MAEPQTPKNYNPFGKLIKITGKQHEAYEKKKDEAVGSIIFADLSEDTKNNKPAGKYIYANGIEYNVASQSDLENLLNTLDVTVADNIIKLAGIEDSLGVKLTGEGYITATTVSGTEATDGKPATAPQVKFALDSSMVTTKVTAQGSTEATYADSYDDDALVTVGYLQKSQELSSTIEASDNTATLKVNLGDSSTSVDVNGDSYVTLTNPAKSSTNSDADTSKLDIALNVTADSEDIDGATSDTKQLANTYAIKTYVEGKLGDITNALTYEGGRDKLDAILKATDVTDDAVGNMYVVDHVTKEVEGVTTPDNTITIGEKVYTLEIGDNVIITGVDEGEVTDVTIVERNLTGAVTTAEASLAEDKIILGSGEQGVKASDYSLGKDDNNDTKTEGEKEIITNTFGASDNIVATEKGVAQYVDIAITEIDATSTTETYIEAKYEDKEVKVGAKVVTLAEAHDAYTPEGETKEVPANTGLADALDVKNYIDNNASKYTIGAESKDSSVYITLNSSKNNEADDSSVCVAVGADSSTLLEVATPSDGEIVFKALTTSMDDVQNALKADATADGKEINGLAKTKDVYIKLVEVEEVCSAAVSAMATTVGLEEDFSVNWEDYFDEGTTVVDAIKSLYAGVGEGVVKVIEAEDALEGVEDKTSVIDEYVAVTATEDANESGKYTLATHVLTAVTSRIDGEDSAKATALATDAFVHDSIYNALAWEVITD